MRNAMKIRNVFPEIFCLEEIRCLPDETGGLNYRATLYHDQACITVSFNCAGHDADLKSGEFVSVRWLPSMRSNHGAIQVAGLSALRDSAKYPDPEDFNPFMSVPRTWDVDRHLINCARDLWDISSNEMRRLLLSAILRKQDIPEGDNQAWEKPTAYPAKTSEPDAGHDTAFGFTHDRLCTTFAAKIRKRNTIRQHH